MAGFFLVWSWLIAGMCNLLSNCMNLCKHCSREINNVGALAAHQKQCNSNPDRVFFTRSPKAGAKKGSKPWNAGLTGDDHPSLRKQVESYKAAYEAGEFKLGGWTHSQETKDMIAAQKRALYDSGWEPVCGRAKKYDYESPVAGRIKVDGTWELMVARHLDYIGVKWERNRKRFKYIKPDGKESTYQPDFYVYDWNTFLEVKGYETQLDQCKWSQFAEPLLIWKKDIIGSLRAIGGAV